MAELVDLRVRIERLEARLAAVERLTTRRGPRDDDDRRVVVVLAPLVVGARFSAKEIHQVAVDRPALAAALVAADCDGPRSIGRLLRRCEGTPIDGWHLARVGADRDGLIWRVSRVSPTPPDPAQD